MEYKNLPYFVKEINAKERTVTGIFAVNGNVDDGGDMSVNGAFKARLGKGRDRVRFLWMHNGYNPPIASIKEIGEVEKSDLPEKVLAWAPEATGGAFVTRKYYEDVPLSDWVFKAIQEGDITEMSYAYEPKVFELVNDEERPKLRRILKEIQLYDISDVSWGMNPATAGVKGLPVPGMTFAQHSGLVVATVEEFLGRVKDRAAFRAEEGRSLSDAQRQKLAQMGEEITSILRETEPKADEKAVLSELARLQQFNFKYGLAPLPVPPISGERNRGKAEE